jgi:hypothetical protein
MYLVHRMQSVKMSCSDVTQVDLLSICINLPIQASGAVYLSVYSCCSHLEHRTSVKRLFHFSFLILDARQDSLDGGSARHMATTYTHI